MAAGVRRRAHAWIFLTYGASRPGATREFCSIDRKAVVATQFSVCWGGLSTRMPWRAWRDVSWWPTSVAQRSVAQANLWSPVSYRGDCVSLRTYLPPTTVACGRHRRPYCVGATALGLAVGYGGGVDRTAHRISLRFIRATGQRSVAVSHRGSRPSWTPCPLCLPGERTGGRSRALWDMGCVQNVSHFG